MPVEVGEGIRGSRSEEGSIKRGSSSCRITMASRVLRTRGRRHLAMRVALAFSSKYVPDSGEFSLRMTGFILNGFVSKKTRMSNDVSREHLTMPVILLAQ